MLKPPHGDTMLREGGLDRPWQWGVSNPTQHWTITENHLLSTWSCTRASSLLISALRIFRVYNPWSFWVTPWSSRDPSLYNVFLPPCVGPHTVDLLPSIYWKQQCSWTQSFLWTRQSLPYFLADCEPEEEHFSLQQPWMAMIQWWAGKR